MVEKLALAIGLAVVLQSFPGLDWRCFPRVEPSLNLADGGGSVGEQLAQTLLGRFLGLGGNAEERQLGIEGLAHIGNLLMSVMSDVSCCNAL